MPDMFNVTESKSWPDFHSMIKPVLIDGSVTTKIPFAASTGHPSSSPINFLVDINDFSDLDILGESFSFYLSFWS
jgi:hypothetical protein